MVDSRNTRLNILFVEDDILMQTIIHKKFEKSGYNLRVSFNNVRTLKDALDKLKSNENIDCVLLDLNLADSIGLSTLSKIRSQSNLPIVILTSQSDEDIAFEAIRYGAQDYIYKDVIRVENLYRSLCFSYIRTEKKTTIPSRSNSMSNE